MIVFEAIIAVLCVIGYLWMGIFIGRNYGSFENFVICILQLIKNNMEQF